jgi:4-hydroxy-4-methyl-2-oxoglutarate aldolase
MVFRDRSFGESFMNTDTSEITLETMRSHFYSAVVSDSLDTLGFRNQSPRIALRPMTGINLLVGRCRTTLWADMAHEDPKPYALELRAVDNCRPDDVLICAAAGSMRSGIWGELLSTAARNSGCAGTVVDGAVRDVAKMTAIGFCVFARATCVYDSLHRQRVIDLDVPVEIDGVKFSPGDLVIADVDGVVVVPREIEAEAVQAAWRKVRAENKVRDEIRNGMKAVDVFEKYGIL